MSRTSYIRVIIASLFLAVILSCLSILGMSRIADMGASQHRGDFLRFFVERVEQKTRALSDVELAGPLGEKALNEEMHMPFGGRPGPPASNELGHGPGSGLAEMAEFPPGSTQRDHDFPQGPRHRDMGPPPEDMEQAPGDMGPPPHFAGPPPDFDREGPRGFGRGHHPFLPPPPGVDKRAEFWLVSEAGKVLASSPSGKPMPVAWGKLDKPKNTQDIAAHDDFFRILPGVYVLKTDRATPTYMVVRELRRPFAGPILLTQAIMTFLTVVVALALSLSIVFYYLRRKSEEARAVLLRLELGDLKARFEIKRFDEFGGLLLDFNRMTQEIERLVTRVHAAEAARKEVLQELGHDVRTPLTSLTTSFETFRFHLPQMSVEQREEIFEMMGAEIEYLKELIEKLMQIATLDEPHYKRSTEQIDLAEMLKHEMKSRQASGNGKISWEFEGNSEALTRAVISGDSHLVMRLFKNALDNAGRFANSKVRAHLELVSANQVQVQIIDDGRGLTSSELDSFAKRREQRTRREGAKLNFSLGLGSVIMKTIAELHEGRVEIRNLEKDGRIVGATVIVTLPLR